MLLVLIKEKECISKNNGRINDIGLVALLLTLTIFQTFLAFLLLSLSLLGIIPKISNRKFDISQANT